MLNRVKKAIFLMTTILVILAIPTSAAAQSVGGDRSGASNDSNILFGDFKVTGGSALQKKPETFHLILYFTSGNVLARTTISNPGRYRFPNVPNGTYDLVVEAENRELSRMRLTIQEVRKTDIQRDLTLEWSDGNAVGGSQPRAVSLGEYSRSAANQAKYDKALTDSKNKNNDGATELLKQIVSDDPKDFVAWTELGTVQFKQDKIADAEKSYLKALEAKPAYIVALMNLGKLQIAQKNFEAAIETLTKAVSVQPKSADANHYLGESYLQVKKGSKAVGYLNEAIKLDPMGKSEIHLRLATLYNAAGLKDKAAVEYEVFLSKKPDHPEKKKLEEYIKANKKM
jgi:tetratricopeptide (TPR) repeat protein